MRLCACPGRPVRSRDPLLCGGCGGWSTAVGAPSPPDQVERVAGLIADLLERNVVEYQWLEGALYGLRWRGSGGGGRSGVSDPTGLQVSDEGRERGRALAALASRMLERTLDQLQLVDAFVGEAHYAVDPGQTVKVDYASTAKPCPACKGSGKVAVVPSGRRDLAEANAAAAKRKASGMAVPR